MILTLSQDEIQQILRERVIADLGTTNYVVQSVEVKATQEGQVIYITAEIELANDPEDEDDNDD